MTVKVIEFGGFTPLNTLGAATRKDLYQKLQQAQRDESVSSIVLIGKGSHFSAGADLGEFSSFDESVINLVDLCHFIESLEKPIVAAIRGVALGGGCEVALSCHFRVVASQAKLGLPEVQVGVIPGAGATQRLPRLIGMEQSLDMILTGKQVSAKRAFEMGLVNAVSTEDVLIAKAKEWAAWAELLGSNNLPRASKKQVSPMNLDKVKKRLPSVKRGGQGVHAALEAVAASTGDFAAGMQTEARLFFETLAGSQGKARRHAFFAVRAAQKPKYNIKNNPYGKEAGVVGAGTMGSGIALVLLLQGRFNKVWLVDINVEALEKGLAFLHKTLDSYVKRGKISEKVAMQIKFHGLVGTTQLQDLRNCNLVVEAVVENMTIKQSIFRELDQYVVDPKAMLLSNTSTLDIGKIASAVDSKRHPYIAGWHFFSPAHVMKLVEIVEIPIMTSPETVSILQTLTKRIGKIGVVVGSCDGFVGNRMLDPYTSEATMLLSEGAATVESVDHALQTQFGMAIGPFQMSDLAGTDIGYFIRKERGLVRDPATGRIGPNRPARYTELADDLVTKLGRVGQKALKGFYDYDVKQGKGRKPLPSKTVTNFVQSYVKDPQPRLTPDEIVERVLYPLVNEGFKILEESIAQRPSDIDVVYLYGYGWPAWRGGPMYWADHEVGLPKLLSRLQEFSKKHNGSKYFIPSTLLETCVSMGVTVEEYYNKGLNRTTSRL